MRSLSRQNLDSASLERILSGLETNIEPRFGISAPGLGGNKGISLYFGMQSTWNGLFCSKNEQRRPFFFPATVPSCVCHVARTLQNTFDTKKRLIAPPHDCAHAKRYPE